MLVKKAKFQENVENKAVARAVEDFCEIKARMDALNEELKTHKDVIVEFAREYLGDDESATLTLISGDNGAKISFGWDIKVADDAALKELLGDKFDVLVKTETIYKPERKLKELALNDDGLKECLLIKEKTPTITLVKA